MMKNRIRLTSSRDWSNIYIITIISLFLMLNNSCKKVDEKSISVLTTSEISNITQTSAISGGNITSDGGASITTRGVCWDTLKNPTIANDKTTNGSGIGNFTSSITGLSINTTYFVRAYATNIGGTNYGNELSIVLWQNIPGPTISDVNGNIYKSVKIGNQIWMTENLNTTRYNNSTLIPNVTNNSEWAALVTPSYRWYKDDSLQYKIPYGALYNWFTVNTGKLCPKGWHVPSDNEWSDLTNYLGSDSFAGGKLKDTGTVYWIKPNTGATNESGFTAVAGGMCTEVGQFAYNRSYGFWWSSTEFGSGPFSAWIRDMKYTISSVERNHNYGKKPGFSVRCVKDL
jgi:uncharacterized protein (TIGR02145 family)